ncbi:MAG: FtsQ-type POTRA domain-containing protein [Bacilli bacterium]|nr:FtsQ-type POTRA domain-containing protein [Bacilli bacterium]
MKHKFKIRYKRLLIFIMIILIIVMIFIKIFNLKISNIYISGNKYLSDQEIIELANISNYPKALPTLSKSIEKKLEKNDTIKKAKVKKKNITKIYIEIEENKPLIYDEISKKTILEDGTKTEKITDIPILINQVNNEIYEEFLEKLKTIEVLDNISEIEYTPNGVDKELFMLTMKDGNYVSVNLNKFSSVNQYLDIIKKFNNKKGILYLDSGEYFKILSN